MCMVLALLGAAVGSYLGGAPACAPGWRRSAVRCQVPVPAAASEFVAISPKEIKVRWLNEALELAAPPSESEAIAAIRDAALVPAQQVQLPGRKDEAWRQTDMASLFATRMVAPLEPPSGALVEQYLERESAGMRLAFVNGIYSEELSDLSARPLCWKKQDGTPRPPWPYEGSGRADTTRSAARGGSPWPPQPVSAPSTRSSHAGATLATTGAARGRAGGQPGVHGR